MMPVLHVGEEDKIRSVSREMSKWVDQVLGPSYQKFCPADAWTPAINFYENPTHYTLVVGLAGISASEIDLRVEQGVLVLLGHRPVPAATEASRTEKLHLMEIDHGRFARRLELPADADVDGIAAHYRNGYLWVRIPKRT